MYECVCVFEFCVQLTASVVLSPCMYTLIGNGDINNDTVYCSRE